MEEQKSLKCTTAGGDTRTCVTLQEGNIPVLLLAGHGGDTKPGDAPVRKKDSAFAGYGDGEVTFDEDAPFDAFDGNTIEVTDAIRSNFDEAAKPYVVKSSIARGFVDNNRRAAGAWQHFEAGSQDAKEGYGLYHDKVAEFCRKMEKTSERALIIDVHGKAADDLNRGTGEGSSISEASKPGIKEDFLKPLQSEVLRQGIYQSPESFIPAGEAFHNDLEASEDPFNGGYTTRHYGVEKLAGYDFAAVGGQEPVFYKSAGSAGSGGETGSLVTFPDMKLDDGVVGREKVIDGEVRLAAASKEETRKVEGAGTAAGTGALYADESEGGKAANEDVTRRITGALQKENPEQQANAAGTTYEPLLERTESPCQVDAVQLEMGPSLKNDHPEETGKAVAAAVKQYYEQRIKK
ncbi:hypothetical protein AN219_25340 [Streptomyces nanshensis]|nr:hypothetical protein AN219_25340 [Streptomyces nanshensis]